MTSSYTTRNRLNKQGTGDNSNLWGEVLNASGGSDLLDVALDGWTTKALTGDVTLSSANGATDEARARVLKFTGTGSFTVTIPSVEKNYFIWNACTGALTVTTGSGATAILPTTAKSWVICNGTDCYEIGYSGLGLKDYIDQAILATTGSLPATTGNEDKVLQVQGGAWAPTAIAALAAAVRAGTATNRFLSPGDTYNALAEVTLTSSGGSVALDFGAMINGFHALTENTTFANPTNAKPGQTGYIRIQQHASSAKTGAFGSNWKRSGGVLALSTTLSGYDFVVYQVITSSYILYDLIRNPS